MKIGYARISTHEQNFDLQMDALRQAGCELFFQDKVSGGKEQRPGLDRMLAQLRKGDQVVVWKLDRLGRSLPHLIQLVNQFDQIGAELRSLQEGLDTASHTGKLIFHIFGAIAEFERGLIQERTLAGLSAARARGRMGGRPKGLSRKNELKSHTAASLYQERKLSVAEICDQLSISNATLYRYLRARGVQIGKE